MGRGAWQTALLGFQGVGHELVTRQRRQRPLRVCPRLHPLAAEAALWPDCCEERRCQHCVRASFSASASLDSYRDSLLCVKDLKQAERTSRQK